VANDGPDDASRVTVTDELPAGVTFVSASDGCIEAQATVTITVRPEGPGAITNAVTVSSGATDPDPTDNAGSLPVVTHCSLSGTAGSDSLTGTNGRDVICGFGGNAIRSRGGDDLVLAGDGADTVQGEGGADELRGGPGADELHGGDRKDRLSDGPGSTG
jgi:Ca2+-binding RTX toxin-like protein